MKSKSVSVENLKSLVEQAVNDALENNEQVIKFHRMIYEEWYFKKWSKLRDTNRKENEITSLPINESDISETVVHRKFYRYRYKHHASPLFAKTDTILSNNTNENKEKTMEKNMEIIFSCRNRDKSSRSDIQGVTGDVTLKRTDSNFIEIWNNSFKRTNHSDRPKNATNVVSKKQSSGNGPLIAQRQNKNKLSFEAWKAKKTLAYQDILKVNRKREWEQKFSRQEQLRKRERYKHPRHQNLSNEYLNTAEPIRPITECNLNSLTKLHLKFNKKKMRTLTARKAAPTNSKLQKRKTFSMKIMENIIIGSWLTQLNSILHRRYVPKVAQRDISYGRSTDNHLIRKRKFYSKDEY